MVPAEIRLAGAYYRLLVGLQIRRHDRLFQVYDTTHLDASELELNLKRCGIFVHRAIEDSFPL